MRIVITGGAGFIGRAVVERLAARGDHVVALVRDPRTAGHLAADRLELVRSDLSDGRALEAAMQGGDAAVHAAGSYRIGIAKTDRPKMWEANVGATERVLDAAAAAGVPRIVYVSTNNILGNTRGEKPDETYCRPVGDDFLSYYDETKYRAHQAAERRAATGAPVVIVQPGQTYGPHDHSQASAILQQAHGGTLRYLAFPNVGLAWVHVHDLADAIVAALDRGRVGEAYSLAGDCHRMDESVRIAAEVGGHRPPRLTVPTALLRLVAPISDAAGGLPGLPADLGEAIRASDGVTYWAGHEKATSELGFRPRSLEEGVADTWGRAPVHSGP
jgi:dihydroflavonol-4-reductase